jgi:uncharacterized protein (TIGR02147 family)
MQSYEHYSDILNEHLEFRKIQNASYSLRAFARDLNIAPSNLSEILRRKQGISPEKAMQIASNLKLSKEESEYFTNLVIANDARSKKERSIAKSNLEKIEIFAEKRQLQEDTFKLISDWYYYAILELLTTENFKSNHKWIAKALGLTLEEVNEAMARLLRLSLIKKVDGNYISTGVQLDTTHGIPSLSIKKFCQQILNKAMKAITDQSLDERELSTLTVAIDSKDLPILKKKIQNFRNDFDQTIIKSLKNKKPNIVYCLSMQFFNLTENNHD